MRGKRSTTTSRKRKRKSDGATNRRATPIRMPVRRIDNDCLNSSDDENSEGEKRARSSTATRKEKEASGDSESKSSGEDDDDDSTDERDELITKQQKEIEHLKRLIGHVTEEKTRLEEERKKARAESEVAVAGMKTKRSIHNDKAWTRQEKVWIQALGSAIRNDVGRRIKFLPKGYKKWSNDQNTICGRVMTHFSNIESDGERKRVWNDVLRHHLSKKLGEYKNKVTQGMREQLKGENDVFF
jgi:hypothetical protein